MEVKYFQIKDLEFKANDSERTIKHFISTPDLDWGGDVMIPKGMDTKMYDKGARTVFYNHRYDSPIGKNMWLKKTDEGVLAKTQFAKSTLFADDIYNLHKEGILASWSVGFDVPTKDGEIIQDAISFDEKTKITTFNKWLLVEYSDAPLPMNPNCLDQAKSIAKSNYFKQIIDYTELQMKSNEVIETMQNDIKELASKYNALETLVKSTDKITNDLIKSTKKLTTKITKEISTEIAVDKKEQICKSAIDGAISRVIIK